MRKAFRKYRANNKEKVNAIQKKTNFNYYHNKNDFRSKKIDYAKKYSKIRYENDIEYRLKNNSNLLIIILKMLNQLSIKQKQNMK